MYLPGYLTPGLLEFEFGNSPIHSSPFDHFCRRKSFLFFSLSFQFVPNSLFKKEKLAKSILLNASDSHENFFLNRRGIHIMQFSVDISVVDTEKYRKLVLTGEICRPWRGRPGL
jgi:hypothetical protein